MNLRVLANGQFTCAAVIACLFGVGLFGSTYLVPLFVQTVQGYTAFNSGLLLMPGGLIMGLFMPIGGFLSDRMPARGLIIAGLICFILSSYWLAYVDVNSGFWMIACCVVLSRIGLALIKPTLNVTALRAIAPGAARAGRRHDQFRAPARRRVRREPALGDARPAHRVSRRRVREHADAGEQRDGRPAALACRCCSRRAASRPTCRWPGALHFLGKVTHAQAYTMGFRDSFLITARGVHDRPHSRVDHGPPRRSREAGDKAARSRVGAALAFGSGCHSAARLGR